MSYPFRYQVNSLLLNNGGDGFLDAEFLTGLEPRAGAPYRIQYELECSGEDSANKLCAGRTGHQPVYGSRGSRSSVVFDLEGDGDLDIVTGELNDVPMVMVSDLASRQNLHWISIKLRGKASNRDGLGAKVTVKAGGKRLDPVVRRQVGLPRVQLAAALFRPRRRRQNRRRRGIVAVRRPPVGPDRPRAEPPARDPGTLVSKLRKRRMSNTVVLGMQWGDEGKERSST